MFGPPRVGVGVIIAKGDRILLLKRRGCHGAGTWSTPGGHLDYGETPERCAAREAKEETSVAITALEFRGVTNDIFDAERKHYITIWFKAEYLSGEPTIGAPDEMSDVGWFEWDNLPSPLFLPLENLLAGRSYPSGWGRAG